MTLYTVTSMDLPSKSEQTGDGTRMRLPVLTPEQMRLAQHRLKHAAALQKLIRGHVRFGRHDRMLYATDASLYQVEPIGVVVPADVEDVRRTVEYCHAHGVPMLPRGGGTSLAGQCTNFAVVMDLSANCRALNWVDEKARACRVEPGVTVDELNDQLRPSGLFFAPDPATSRQATIGGCVGNNAAGTRSILYGRTAENLEALNVVLASGEETILAEGCAQHDRRPNVISSGGEVLEKARREAAINRRLALGVIDIVKRHERLIRERFPRTLRRNAGYALDMMLQSVDEARRTGRDPLDTLNLAHLVCGSEGTLAIITGATLKLQPIPKAKGLAVIGFPSLEEAIDAVVPLLALGPSAVELLDDMVIGLARMNNEYQNYVRLMPQPSGGRDLAAVLYVEFFGQGGGSEIEARFDLLRTLMERVHPAAAVACYTDATEMAQALKLRKAGEPLLHAIAGNRKPLGFVEDNAVPVENLATFVREFKRIVASHGTKAAFYAHASVGVLHVRPLLDLRDPADRHHMEGIAVEVADLAKSLGGVMSGEHGDGRVRGPLLERYFGPQLMSAFREIKRVFDPGNLLNPGNIVAPAELASIHERVRVRPDGSNLEIDHHIDTYFEFGAEGGIAHAVELCNGSGVCRKKYGGTMCPSYMGTLDERHSTRGRGNALRLAISGQLNGSHRPQWLDEETLATLDLCLSCKGCKTECPTNVDIARYKSEFLAQRYREKGRVPLKARVFGDVRTLNRIGSFFAPASNWAQESRPARFIIERFLGVARDRKLPDFAPSLLSLAARIVQKVPAESPKVLLFSDCFTTYNEPWIGAATIRVMNRLGYRVVVSDAGCCGRALISTGLLDKARREISQTALRIDLAMEHHDATALLVCEPSCLAAIKDDWRDLRLNVSQSRRLALAESAVTPEDFFAERVQLLKGDFPTAQGWGTSNRNILLHGHCHQKALWGTGRTEAGLRQLAGPSERVHVLDTGCCGMAGSFGYTQDHYELSMRIGNLNLFPAVRRMETDDVILAPGTSCRHQIHDGTGRKALHPIEWIDRGLRQD